VAIASEDPEDTFKHQREIIFDYGVPMYCILAFLNTRERIYAIVDD
jgi:hypothetical protein